MAYGNFVKIAEKIFYIKGFFSSQSGNCKPIDFLMRVLERTFFKTVKLNY